MANNNNGRVNFVQPDLNVLFAMKDRITNDKCSSYYNATTGNNEQTPLSLQFFSDQNIMHIQNQINEGVFRKSNGAFNANFQNNDAVKNVMQSIYTQFSHNRFHNLPNQLADLNQKVVEYLIKDKYNEAKAYSKYIHDINNLPVPIARPRMPDNNDKQLQLKPWF